MKCSLLSHWNKHSNITDSSRTFYKEIKLYVTPKLNLHLIESYIALLGNTIVGSLDVFNFATGQMYQTS